MAENDILYVEMVEKEIITVEFSTIDVVPSRANTLDVELTNPEEYHILRYDSSLCKWVNVSFDEFLNYFLRHETPTKISSKQFRTAYKFYSGTIEVYLNGIKEKEITVIDDRNFEFKIDTISTDTIEVKYIKKEQ